MRLTTLSRKIDKTPTQLIAFLEKHGIEIENGLHTKLGSETVEMVLAHFLPNGDHEKAMTKKVDVVETAPIEMPEVSVPKQKKVVKEPVKEKKKTKKSTVLENSEPVVLPISKVEASKVEKIPIVEAIKIEPKTGTVDDLENENFNEVELIKAKKIKLEGFKVIGKIELPAKPKKGVATSDQVDAENSNEKTIKNPRSDDRKFDRDRKKNQGQVLRNPLTYAEKLKREEREKLRQRKKKEKEGKLRNKKLYEETIKAKNIKSPKKKKVKNTGSTAAPKNKAVTYKNPIKRLWAWLNGQYDKF